MLDEAEGKNNVYFGKYLHGGVLASNLSCYSSLYLSISLPNVRWNYMH